MAIVKLKRKHCPFQVKLRGPDGKWITKAFSSCRDAEEFEGKLSRQKFDGTLVSNSDRHMTLNQYYETWMETVQHQASPGWRSVQKQLYRDYVKPLIGLASGQIFIQRAFSRKDSWATKQVVIKEYPKGGKHHTLALPPELWDFLKEKKKEANSIYAAPSSSGKLIRYERYRRRLAGFCKELGIPTIGTHGLRHSTSAVYMSHGASKDDLRVLFAHSCLSLTERYTHGVGSSLQRVSNVIRLFDAEKCSTQCSTLGVSDLEKQSCSTDVPHSAILMQSNKKGSKVSSLNH